MKKVLIPVLMLVTLLFFSCDKKGEATPASSEVLIESVEAVSASGARNHGYVLRDNAGLYAVDGDTGTDEDKTRYLTPMTLGERVSVGETRRITFASDGQKYNFIEVRRDNGAEGVAFATQVSDGGNLAVVVDEKANLYRSAKSVDVTGLILPYKNMMAYFPETETDGFVEIMAYDPQAQVYRRNHIRLSSISRKNTDIQSAVLLQIAQALKEDTTANKNRKSALLDAALLDYPDSVFYAEIHALVNPNAAVVIQTESVSLPSITSNNNLMMTKDGDVDVRDIPDVVAGRVIGSVSEGDALTVDQCTSDKFTVDGKTDYWYHLNDPVEGWVFGAYLLDYK